MDPSQAHSTHQLARIRFVDLAQKSAVSPIRFLASLSRSGPVAPLTIEDTARPWLYASSPVYSQLEVEGQIPSVLVRIQRGRLNA